MARPATWNTERGQVGLRISAKKLGVTLHEAGKVHLAFLVGIPNQEYLHLDHIAHLEAETVEGFVDGFE
ncbi:hypothetical protein [Mesorhizobium sp. A556]